MKDNIYWLILFIHVTIYIFLTLSGFAADPSIEDKFQSHEYAGIVNELKNKISLEACEKVYLARAHFHLGNLQHTKTILDTENRIQSIQGGLPDGLKNSDLLSKTDLESLSHNDRAKVFMYLGYFYIKVKNELGVLENFANAFISNPYLEFNAEPFKDPRLEALIVEAKIAAQMEREPQLLDLLVAVDVSGSVSKEQIGQIEELQLKVKEKLKPDDGVAFYRFGGRTSDFTVPISSPSSASIVEAKYLRSDNLTDFSLLFQELGRVIEGHSRNSAMSKKAVLIISDGEHSESKELEEEAARIPTNAAEAIKEFSASHKDVPVVIITVDRMIGREKVKKGSDYATKWTKELTKHCVGKSFYYKPSSKPEDSLTRIFDIIAPHRDKVLLSRNPYSEINKEFFFSEKNNEYIVGLNIQCTLPKAELVVEGHPNWKIDSYSDLAELFSVKWEEREEGNPNRDKKDKKSNILSLTNSAVKYENLKITCLNLEKAFPVSREPREFTLTFSLGSGSGTNQKKLGIDKISLLFKQKLPAAEITKRFSETFVMRSNVKNHLKFQLKIDLPDHLQQRIPLTISVPENNCFYEYQEEQLLPKDTTGSPGRQEFHLPIKAKRVDNIWHRISDDNILINFKTANNGKVQPIDADRVGAINFRVVSRQFYWLYWINKHIMWMLFSIVFVLPTVF